MDPNIEQLTDERDTHEAQRDHYRDLSASLQTHLTTCQNQLSSKFQTSKCNIDPEIFNGESLERLREWRKCLDFVIEEVEGKMREKGNEMCGENEEGRDDGDDREGEGKKGKVKELELPFSPSNLTGFLTKNHKLTQGRTKYPEPRPKNH
jgi:uncharacterized protein with gpF-like domain